LCQNFSKIIDVAALNHQHVILLLHATGSRSATPRIHTGERSSVSSCAEAIACRRAEGSGVGGGGRPRGGSRSYGGRPQRHWASGRRHDAALSTLKRENATAKCRDTRTRSYRRSLSGKYPFSKTANETLLKKDVLLRKT